MDSALTPQTLSKNLQWCDPVFRRTNTLAIELRVRSLHNNLTFEDCPHSYLSCSEVPAHFSAIVRAPTIHHAYFHSTARCLSHRICRPCEDIWDDVNDFSSLSIQSYPALSESRSRPLQGQTGDNTPVDYDERSIDGGFSVSIAFLHDPSQELVLLHEPQATGSSDAYHTAYNYQTLSFDSVGSFVDRPVVSHSIHSVDVSESHHRSSQPENSYWLDPSNTIGTVQHKPLSDVSDYTHVFRESSRSVTLSVDSFRPLLSLDDTEKLSAALDDRIGESNRTEPCISHSSLLTESGIELYGVIEEWLQPLPHDPGQMVELAVPNLEVNPLICSQPIFTVHNLRRSLQASESCESPIASSVQGSLLQYAEQPLNSSEIVNDKINGVLVDFRPHRTNTQGLSSLFLQNSASDKDGDPTMREPADRSPNSSVKSNTGLRVPSNIGQSMEHRSSRFSVTLVHNIQKQLRPQRSDSVASIDENKDVPSETRLSRFSTVSVVSPQLQHLPIEPGTRPSMVSVCGVEMDVDELKSLCDVPPEFTTAEVLCRRAIKSDPFQGERNSIFNKNSTQDLSRRLSSLEEPKKRSSILAMRKPDELNAELRTSRNKTGGEFETVQGLATHNKAARSSLIMVHHPQASSNRTIDDATPGHEAPELCSRITGVSWASIDSTELSRGLYLVHWVKNSSSEALDTLIGTRESGHSDLSGKNCSPVTRETQANRPSIKSLTTGTTRRFSPGQLYTFNKTYPITPALHHCEMGHINEEVSHRRTASPDSSRFIGLMKKFAHARLEAKSQRFTDTRWCRLSNVNMVYNYIPRRNRATF